LSEISPDILKFTKGEKRYLRRSFLIAWPILAIANLIAAYVFMNSGANSLSHKENKRAYGAWPSYSFDEILWPLPHIVVYHEDPSGYVRGYYAIGHSKPDTRYTMDVIETGFPLSTIEIKKSRVTKGGQLVHSTPPVGKPARMRWKLTGVLLNPTIIAGTIWIFVAYLPVAIRRDRRRTRAKARLKQSLCQVCGYDILDLPICPECGTASHKSEAIAQDPGE
jgi:ribosomal protein L32